MTNHDPQVDAAGILGVAIAKRTGERRIVTVEEYFRIDAVIAGDLVEMEGGLFEPAVAVAADPQH